MISSRRAASQLSGRLRRMHSVQAYTRVRACAAYVHGLSPEWRRSSSRTFRSRRGRWPGSCCPGPLSRLPVPFPPGRLRSSLHTRDCRTALGRRVCTGLDQKRKNTTTKWYHTNEQLMRIHDGCSVHNDDWCFIELAPASFDYAPGAEIHTAPIFFDVGKEEEKRTKQ